MNRRSLLGMLAALPFVPKALAEKPAIVPRLSAHDFDHVADSMRYSGWEVLEVDANGPVIRDAEYVWREVSFKWGDEP